MIIKETLELLEWERLCQHLATFAATKLGAMAARGLVLPTTKEESIKLLTQTKEIYALEQQLDSGWTFQGIKDIGDYLEKAKIGRLISAKELLDIATTLAGVRRLRRLIDTKAEEMPALNQLIIDLRTYPEIEQDIHYCIDDRGEVTERASPKIGEIRSKIKSLREKISKILQNILQKQGGAIQEAVITQRSNRFVLAVKAPQKDSIPGIVHDTSSTGSTLYIEPNSIVGLGNQLKTSEKQEQREIEAVLRALTEKVSAVQEDLERVLAVATILDLATARARYSLWLEANPPRFIDTPLQETITLRRLRHPLLVWQQKHEEGTAVVPIDVKIDPKIRVVAITGPNTGGKTVTLKTFGLAALMAKVGLFIPAQEPVEIPWFGQILADIGDEQSLQQSLSTFSGHIRRISRIIEALSNDEALNQSLILLDEVGAGTDPAEGSALAIALLKYLAEHALLTVATTHYGELKALKYQDERFENASVEFNDATLQPTYRLLWGIPGRSNALAIARRLGLNSDIVAAAEETVGLGATDDVNQVIAALEAQRREQEAKAQEASQLLAQTERFYGEVSAKASSLQEREKELKLAQEKAVQKEIDRAKGEIAQVIRQLQQGEATAQKAQKATQAIDKISQKELAKTQPRLSKPNYKPQVGEKVRIPSLGQTGEVLSIEEEQETLTVRFGIMKMTVSLTEIESLDGQKVETPPKQNKQKSAPTQQTKTTSSKPPVTVRTSKNTIDIRGSRVANAEVDLENAISKAIESGVLWIIHGKGTGRLRQGVHEFLQQHPLVEKFELAPQKEGGAGVTIAYLK